MRIQFLQLELTCRESVELVEFSSHVTFIHGPVGTGKSTVARLIDFCLGGDLVKTKALRRELLVAQLTAKIGRYDVVIERELEQNTAVRVSWQNGEDDLGSVVAPLQKTDVPILSDNVFTFSDLVFHFAGITPIKVRKSKMDPDSELVRLSFRDVMWYCYLRQEDLDSSFFQMDHPFKRNKSIDVMRYVVGFHSDRLNELEHTLARLQDQMRVNRAAAHQIREFLRRFELGSDVGIDAQISQIESALATLRSRRKQIEADMLDNTHAIEPLRQHLRELSRRLGNEEEALADLRDRVSEQESLLADIVGAKVKASRSSTAESVLAGVHFSRCPQCGLEIAESLDGAKDACTLCGQHLRHAENADAVNSEVLRQDLNSRIDELETLIGRHRQELEQQKARVEILYQSKKEKDQELNHEMQQYDSAYVSQVRAVDRDIAELEERRRQFLKLAELPRALEKMERESGEMEGDIRNTRAAIEDERQRLRNADARIRDVESAFLSTMLAIGFPGIEKGDRVEISRRNWKPRVFHGPDDEEGWDFDEAGSGGKQVLFNVCYALAVHRVAEEHNLPLPSFLIVDSPTKNISADVNPILVANYFKLIYSLADGALKQTQFILIDSDLIKPDDEELELSQRLLSKDEPLISYYDGP